MKKMFLLIIVIIFMSGCNIKYNLNIDENLNHTEVLEVDGKKTDLGLSSLDNQLNFYLKNKPFYEVSSKTETDDTYKVVINANQGNEKIFKSSEVINYLYSIQLIIKNNRASYYFYPNKKYNQQVFDVENNPIIFSLSSKLPVLETNADKVTDNGYTWYITKELKEISFILDTTNIKKSEEQNGSSLKKIKPTYVYIFLGGIVAFFFILIIVKHNKGGKI